MIGPLEGDGLKVRPGSFQTVHSHFINDFSGPITGWMCFGNVPSGVPGLEFAEMSLGENKSPFTRFNVS